MLLSLSLSLYAFFLLLFYAVMCILLFISVLCDCAISGYMVEMTAFILNESTLFMMVLRKNDLIYCSKICLTLPGIQENLFGV